MFFSALMIMLDLLCIKGLLDVWQASVIKGNAGELAALAGTTEVTQCALASRVLLTFTFHLEVESRGVDSVGSGFKDPETFVKNLAKRERELHGLSDKLAGNNALVGCVVVLTGPVDYISDGKRVAVLRNGPDVLAKITGSGCMLGSIIASYCATAAHLAVQDLTSENGQLFKGDMFVAAIAG